MRKSILYTALTAMIAAVPGAAFADCIDQGSTIIVDGKVIAVDQFDSSVAGSHVVRVRTATLGVFYWFANTNDDDMVVAAQVAEGRQQRIWMETDATACPGAGSARSIGNIQNICTTQAGACFVF